MAPSATSPVAGAHENRDRYGNGQLDAVQPATNGHSNGNSHVSHSEDELLDLICVGFGPASLAIAIALHDTFSSSTGSSSRQAPKVQFLEKQSQFAWHAGMQLPGAKMQISFLKDLATPRDPRSRFTFLNYLFAKGRLNQFINLGTFLPARIEYEDYLRWCAGHFEREGKVAYGTEVESVRAGEKSKDGRVRSFVVTARDRNGDLVTRRARHVVIAVGGRPVIPQNLSGLKHVAHSSQYATSISSIQKEASSRDSHKKPPRFAVVGSGQSAAEIFNDLWDRFPQSEIKLIIKGASLRPSDDSPFVNEIFDPERVDEIYARDPSARAAANVLDRATNYGVVRLELLEHLYQRQYMQRLHNPDASHWRAQILPNRIVTSALQSPSSNSGSSITLTLGLPSGQRAEEHFVEEELEVDYIFTATGYKRNAHEEMLEGVRNLLPAESSKEGKFSVARDYHVLWDEEKVAPEAGVWLQGCNEGTHGLSDTLLSILAVRGGELVRSIFGEQLV